MGVVGDWHMTARQLSHIFLFSSVALSMELGVLARVPGFFAHCAQDGASSTFLFGMARYRAVETGYLSQTSLVVCACGAFRYAAAFLFCQLFLCDILDVEKTGDRCFFDVLAC